MFHLIRIFLATTLLGWTLLAVPRAMGQDAAAQTSSPCASASRSTWST